MQGPKRAVAARTLGAFTLAIVAFLAATGCGDDSCTCPVPSESVEHIKGIVTADMYFEYGGDGDLEIRIWVPGTAAGGTWEGASIQIWILRSGYGEHGDYWSQIIYYGIGDNYVRFWDTERELEGRPYVVIITQ